jgi:putative SOS response-associated peptidase YedK
LPEPTLSVGEWFRKATRWWNYAILNVEIIE